MLLDTEQDTYARHLPDLLGQPGRFAVVGGAELVGVYDTYDDALAAGYARFGLKPFMVRQIDVDDRVNRFTRDPGAACPT